MLKFCFAISFIPNMIFYTSCPILLFLFALGQFSSEPLSVEDYCLCLEFDRESCFCGPQQAGSGAVVYCNGRNFATSFPLIENPRPESCRLNECAITIVFEHYRAVRIQDYLLANLVKSHRCVIGFVHRYNPELREIRPNAFATYNSTIKDLFIEHTSLTSTNSIAAALQATKFDCGGNTVVSFSHNRLNDWLKPELTSSLKCVDTFSLNNNPLIRFWMTALNGLNLTRLSLSNVSASQISEFSLRGSNIVYLDISGNYNLIVKSSASDGSSDLVIENLKLPMAATVTYSLATSNDPMSPTQHLVCSKQESQCGCVNLAKNGNQKNLGEMLKACQLASNICSEGCSDAMFSIPDADRIPSQYKDHVSRRVAFTCAGSPTDTLKWYRLSAHGSIDQLEHSDTPQYK